MASVTYLQAIRQGLWEEMERDPAVFCMGEDIGIYGGAFGVTQGMIDRFGPERIIDTPIAESAMVGSAFGASLLGMRPVVEFQFMDFIGCAFNQITNMLAKSHYRWNAPASVVLRGPSGGGVHGGPFHSQNPEMHFVHTPGLKVVCPGTPRDAYGLIKSAIRDNNPVIFCEHKFLYRRLKEELPTGEDFVIPLGKARVAREGQHLSVITYAAMLQVALEAAEILSKEGIETEILDLRSLLPLDSEAIVATVKKTNHAIVLHEDTRTGGIAGEIAAIINEEAFDDLDGPIVRITSPDSPVPFSPPLEKQFLPTVSSVVEKGRWLKRLSEPSQRTSIRLSRLDEPVVALPLTSPAGSELVPMSLAQLRQAQRAVASEQTSPHVFMQEEIDLSRTFARFPRRINAGEPAGTALQLVPFLAWAACTVLQNHAELNSSIESDSIRYHDVIQLSVEFTERPLQVWLVEQAQKKTIDEFQQEFALLEATPAPTEDPARGTATFTMVVSAPGAIVDMPLIRQPQVAILAMGAVRKRPVAGQEGANSGHLTMVPTVRLTLGHDHRVVDGATAAAYLAQLKRLLEYEI